MFGRGTDALVKFRFVCGRCGRFGEQQEATRRAMRKLRRKFQVTCPQCGGEAKPRLA